MSTKECTKIEKNTIDNIISDYNECLNSKKLNRIKRQKPPLNKDILVYDGKGFYVGQYIKRGDQIIFRECCSCLTDTITHWIELPEKPR